MSERGDQIGDAVANALNSPPLDLSTGGPSLDEKKHRIWRAICNELDIWFEEHWIDLYVDPSTSPVYITGTTPYPMQTIAWQLASGTNVPVAIWLKNGTNVLAWARLWPCVNANPAVEGSYLYPANIGDPMWRGEASYILMHAPELQDGYGFDNGIANWTQITGVCTWRRYASGQIYGRDSGGGNTIPLSDGALVGCHLANPNLDAPYLGLYEVVDCGVHFVGGFPNYTQAVIRRASNANTPTGLRDGMTYQITGTGGEFEGEYFTQTTDDPIVVDTTPLIFTHSPTYTPATAEDASMLTLAQLSTAGADGNSHTALQTIANGKAYFPDGFITLSGTPGVEEIAAGMWESTDEYASISEWGNGVVTIGWDVFVLIGGVSEGDLVISLESAPLSITPTPQFYQAELATAFTNIAPTDTLLFAKFIRNTGTTAVTAGFVYGNPWTSKIKTTLNLPSFGTTDHAVLDNRFPDVGPLAEDLPAHKWNGIGPSGRSHHELVTGTINSGILTIPNDSDFCAVAMGSATEIVGINATGFLTGAGETALIRVLVTDASAGSPKSLRTGESVSSPALPLVLLPKESTGIPQDLTFRAPKIFQFLLDNTSGVWRQI